MKRTANDGKRRSLLVKLLVGTTTVMVTAVPAAERTYQVQQGDTLYRIAQTHHITLDGLLQVNHLPDNAVLKIGQTLALPPAPAPAAMPLPAAASTYQVQAGDNLFRIAEQLGTSVESLTALNGLTEKSILQIGQSLRVPGGDDAPTKAASPAAQPKAASGTKAAVAVTTAAKSAAALPEWVWVCETRVHLRAGASTQRESLGLVGQGARLKVTGKDDMWWRVEAPGSGRTCYVAGWVVKDEPVAAPAAAAPRADEPLCVAYAVEARVNVRAEPDLESERVAVAVRGTRMDVIEDAGGWLKVKFDNGQVGWIARHLVRTPPAGGGDGQGSKGLVETAMSFVGTPYARGGTSRGGVDCSGLVYAVCRAHGIKLPRSSRDMWGHGTAVARGNLRPGDLVFFKNTYRSGISHVGIFIGNNQFVHAVRPGRGVQVSGLGEGYYANRWAGAYRVAD